MAVSNGKHEHPNGTGPVYDPIAVDEAFANRWVAQLRNDAAPLVKLSEKLCS